LFPDDDVPFVRLLQRPGEVEAEAQGSGSAADAGLFGLPDFVLGVAESGKPIEGNIVEAVKHGKLIPTSNQKTIFIIRSARKNPCFKAAEILHSAALRSE
jgi:hypothetical protein